MVRKRKSANKKTFMLVTGVLALILLGVVMLNFYLFLNKPIESEEVEVSFEVGDYIGLAGGTDTLHFGAVGSGMQVEKRITLENNYAFPVRIDVLMTPNLEGYVFGKRSVHLNPSDKVYYSLSLRVPSDAEYGNYSGALLFETFRDN